jgi:hypothetical protein
MPLDSRAIPLAQSHLEAGIGELERDAEGGRYNTLCIRALAGAAVVLRQQDVVDRAIRLLRAAPDGAFWAGIITNIELPKTIPEGLRTVNTPEKLEEQHPPYREEDIVGRIRSYARTEEHFALCLEGRIQEARSRAKSGVRLEEVGDTLAVLGEFDAALSVARDPGLDDFRQRGVFMVLVIELYRRGHVEKAGAILAELESAGLGAWERIHLALGLAGREPWGGYPHPDW